MIFMQNVFFFSFEIFHFERIFMGILLKRFFSFLSDSQQCVKNVNQQQPKVKRTLKTSNSKVIASSLLLVLVLSAICDVTGESSSAIFSALNSTFASEKKVLDDALTQPKKCV
jgi:hypothetical protein